MKRNDKILHSEGLN
ncbi:hypothetical protein [Escherichia coli]|nr:hypothetical protein [Escherichia coli]